MATLTPMMQQYVEIKEQYKDCILFFRLGDFYEMFFEDAKIASRELEITLTSRECGLDEKAHMCGVPFHSADSYISKLVNKGYKVAICEQVEDPAQAKGIVKRDVVRVVTPGTVTESSMLEEKKNNYLMSIYKLKSYFGLAVTDLSTGEFLATSITLGNTIGKLFDELAKFSPSEIIVNGEFEKDTNLAKSIKDRFNVYISKMDDKFFSKDFSCDKLNSYFKDYQFEFNDFNLYINASGALLGYLEQTQKMNLSHIQNYTKYEIEEYMVLDISTRRNLELTETMREKARKGSLLWVLDRTMTSMGGRNLRKWIEQPLINLYDINDRLKSVNELKEKFMIRMEIRELLKRVYDIERLMGKVILGSANCRDLIAIKNSIAQIPYIKELLKDLNEGLNVKYYNELDPLLDVHDLLERAIVDEPPVTVKEGGIIKEGFNEEVDKYKKASREGKNWIASLESKEREKTGIKNLKIGYNKVFGYYIEVTKSYYSQVPKEYVRKQTLANCERYITEELKKIEDTVLGAQERLIELEYNLFTKVRETVSKEVNRIKTTAQSLSNIDVLCTLAEVADRENYVMPKVINGDDIEIVDGRHPVVEKMINEGEFVPNDTYLDRGENLISVITGPNMSGKSTYMRQVALIVLMAQIGSFVPAKNAKIGIVDRIFTRVGASDDLASGQSTFMVEMTEVANILNNATGKSLLILDEIGRGTSTYDGLSIAWSVIEFAANKEKLGARTLFATHYHELTELENSLDGIKNYCIVVEKKGDDIIFLRKIKRGGADDSYGIEVAKLAGVPLPVINRAKEILKELENADISKRERRTKKGKKPIGGQIDIFSFNSAQRNSNEVLSDLKEMDISTLTPLDALNTLYNLQKKVRDCS